MSARESRAELVADDCGHLRIWCLQGDLLDGLELEDVSHFAHTGAGVDAAGEVLVQVEHREGRVVMALAEVEA